MKIKALFLLFTFLLSSAVGLNCALHKNNDCCNETAGHRLDLSLQTQHSHHKSFTTVADKDACCQDVINNFASLPKLVPQSVKVFMPVAVAHIRANDSYTFKLSPAVEAEHQLLIDKRHRPPTQDIRIAIQSFQI